MFLRLFFWCRRKSEKRRREGSRGSSERSGRTGRSGRRGFRHRDEEDIDIDTFLEVLTDLDCQEEEDAEGALAVAEYAEMTELRRNGEIAREDRAPKEETKKTKKENNEK